MRHKLTHTLIAAAGFGVALVMPAHAEISAGSAKIDRDAIYQSGGIFILELSDALAARAGDCAAVGDRACAAYFTARLQDIASGGEAYALPVPATADLRMWEQDGPPVEYAETYALITSEAADMEPRAIARIQTAYEGWVHATSQPDPDRADLWHMRWRDAMDEFTAPRNRPPRGERLMSSIN